MQTTFIYTLIDPRTKEARYIGYTKDPKIRLSDHIRNAIKNDRPDTQWKLSVKEFWILDLIKLGLEPIMVIVAEVRAEDRKYWEAFFGEVYRSCSLLNTKELSKRGRYNTRGYDKPLST